MSQLNQILAVEKGVRAHAAQEFVTAVHVLGQAPRLSGISRTYQPRDDDGEALPPESTRVQLRTGEVLDVLRSALGRLFDVTLTKDVTNAEARAPIVVDGTVIAEDVPATTLIFLEKQLADLLGFVSRLPVLDPADQWSYDAASDAYATEPVRTARSKKVPRNHVLAEATAHHPAQVTVYNEDVVVGYWTTVKYSGALPQREVTEMKRRVAVLAEAVKVAREKANMTAVTDRQVGDAVFRYLLG